MKKPYHLNSDQIRRLLPDMGFAFITDRVAVDGLKIGYMKRSEPTEEGDSGWVFMAGDETQDYIDNPDNTSLMALNTIANYDTDIIPFITYPVGSEIERSHSGPLEPTKPTDFQPEVTFLRPVNEGSINLTKSWSIDVPDYMLRRVDHGDLIIWRPGMTLYIDCYTSDDTNQKQNADSFQNDISEGATNITRTESDNFIKISYDLIENTNGKTQPGTYINGFYKSQIIHMAIYYDSNEDRAKVDSIDSSLTANGD